MPQDSKSGKNNINTISNPTELLKKATWLVNELSDSKETVAVKRIKNQNRATIIKMASLILSAFATILLGLQIAGIEAYSKPIAFACVTLVTLLNSMEPYFNFRALWIEHEFAKGRFHELNAELLFYLEGKEQEDISEDVILDIYERYQEIWRRLSKVYTDLRIKELPKSLNGITLPKK